ncbi:MULTISPECIES: hypothetical protein [Staphylococcus]|uniref:hypothetical protein n=1 Tax=Staphylococcus TaxID=1279 RepID=UPI00298EF32C|nr:MULTISPECIES: hypothetical protein [Staphylococcus]MDW8546339.1 hypothetical protein [Staphylococcus pseudoxylosus]MDW8567809.1 hypothetical protein [Staphylococcus shinii]
MKIKTKKQLNLPQLIEWAWENKIKDEIFTCEYDSREVYFDNLSRFVSESYISNNTTFTVEVEEEITEDTKLDLVERFIGGMGSVCYTSHTMSIKECLKRSPRDCTTTHFYIENDDRELILIWRDGKLVE